MTSIGISQEPQLQRIPPPNATWGRLNICDELVAVAEKELAAFAAAVNQRFGPEEARQSSEDWLEELALFDCSRKGALPDFLEVTIVAAGKLAHRVCGTLMGGDARLSR